MKSKNLSENILRTVKAKGFKYIELDHKEYIETSEKYFRPFFTFQ